MPTLQAMSGGRLGYIATGRYAPIMEAELPIVNRGGLVPYREAWAWQQAYANEVRAGEASEVVVILEHPPVYTCGRRTDPAHLLSTPEQLAVHGIEVVYVERGGDVTYHGPGQLVAYPILNLRTRNIYPISFVRRLEQTIVMALATLGVPSEPKPGKPGVWVGGDKIASLGVHVSGGVSTHGISINIDPDLEAFRAIVPCGLHDAGVTSVAHYCGLAPDLKVARDSLVDAFTHTFDASLMNAGYDMVVPFGR